MTTSIAIASGKGGVGKTTISVNLSLSLALNKKNTILLDADLGMANTNLVLGVNPTETLEDVVEGRKKLQDVIVKFNSHLSFIAGGTSNLLNLPQTERMNLIRQFETISSEFDYMIVDIGAGGEENTVSFMAASDKVIIVMTDDSTSYQNAYSLIKVSSLLKEIHNFGIIVNLNSSSQAKSLFKMLENVTTRFLDVKLNYLGNIPVSTQIKRSINLRVPFMTDTRMKESVAYKSFVEIGNNIENLENNTLKGIRFFEN